MSRQFSLALLLSIALHSALLVVQCKQSAPVQENTEIVELLEEPEELPELEAPTPTVTPPPPPPPPPVAVKDPPPETPPPDAPTELVKKMDSTPPPKEPIKELVVEQPMAPNTPTNPASTSSRSGPSGDSEPTNTVGTDQLDNSDFKPFGNTKPSYPEAPRKMGIEGLVEMIIVVNPEGRVQSIEVVRFTGHPSFAESAKATAKNWRFAPPRSKGKPVKARYKRTIEFRLR